jgi:hypothetical protein
VSGSSREKNIFGAILVAIATINHPKRTAALDANKEQK